MSKRKTPSAENNPNYDFCEFLTELADYEKNVNCNIFKSNAYRKAAAALAKWPTRISSGKEAQSVEGVGKSIAKKIDEFLSTGKLRKLDSIREDSTAKTISELTRVSGIGPAKAKELIDQGILSINELKDHEDLLTHHQIIGLRYLEDFEKRIPRCDVEQYEPILRTAIADLDPQFKLTVCGSYRRGLPECGDVDVLLTHPSFVSSSCPKQQKKSGTVLLKQVVEHLKNRQLVDETLALGDVKYMGTCLLNNTMRRIDIRLTPHDQYYCAVLYFTGSDVFNQNMRKHALSMNFTLNEYTLRRIGDTGVIGEPVPIQSEQDIFDYIEYPYRSPPERNA
ncbi:hypothetical protein M8J75_000184 [Diaphorina citri]|nr:hypothetical protein M8J75_000184 [Diaphorina citri]